MKNSGSLPRTPTVSHLYSQFLSETAKGAFRLTPDIFNNQEILDCLEHTSIDSESFRTITHQLMTFSPNPIGTLLVAGAGSGRMANDIRSSSATTTITELDINPHVINRLNAVHSKDRKRTAVLGTVESIPFPDNSFDALVCYSTLRYVKNKTKAMTEYIRVVKPGGSILVVIAKHLPTKRAIESSLNHLSVTYLSCTVPQVALPRLSFFYFLTNKYQEGDAAVTSLIDSQPGSDSVIQRAFRLSGCSHASLYMFYWKKI